MSFTMKQRRSLRAVVLSVMVLTLAQFCFLGEAKKKFQKCPLHAKKVSIAITKLKSQQECRFLSVLVPVKDEDVPALADALAENTGVESFFLGPKCKLSDYGIKTVMEAVARNKHLSTFGLWSEDTTDYALEQVGKMLESNDVVESLSIDNADLVTGKGVESIGNGLMKNRNVKTITLRVGKTSDESMLPLFRTLSKPDSPVRMLTFTTKSEEESERFGDRAAIALSQHLEKNKELLVLNLQHTNIGDIGATAIFQALANHTELNHLALRNCSKITDAGGVIIGQYIESDPGLTELMLDHSSIGDQGARYIGKALSKNSHLDTLSLVNTPISDTGALAIVSGMNDNMILTDVVLRRTGRNVREMWREALLPKIEKDTEKMLADILKRNKEWKPLVHRLAELEGKTAAAAAAAARGEQDDDSSQTTTAGERHSEL